jgi:hypothetical protein
MLIENLTDAAAARPYDLIFMRQMARHKAHHQLLQKGRPKSQVTGPGDSRSLQAAE